MSAPAEIMALVDKHTPGPSPLGRCGLSPAAVRALTGRRDATAGTPSPDEIRRAAALAFGKQKGGHVPLPDYVVRAMYSEYLKIGATRAARMYGRSRQGLQDLFKNHGYARMLHRPRERRHFNGHTYSDHGGGLFARRYRENGRMMIRYLHRDIFEAANGPIPAGHRIVFQNGDQSDLRPTNLVCMPAREAIARSLSFRNRKMRKEAA